MFKFSASPTLEELRKSQEIFNYEKMKWGPWQTPRNLFLALIGELSELAVDAIKNESLEPPGNDEEEEEKKSPSRDFEGILNELDDVCSYLICLAHECNVDIGSPESVRGDGEKKVSFTETSWDELEVSAFYSIKLPSKSTLLRDCLGLCLTCSRLCDLVQFTDVERGLVNLSTEKQGKVDRAIKSMFCHVTSLASRYRYDMPRLLEEKNQRTANKYSGCEGYNVKSSKEDVINKRYGHLKEFPIKDSGETKDYDLDRPVKLVGSVERAVGQLVVSAGLIAEVLQWSTDGTPIEWGTVRLAHVAHQLSLLVRTLCGIAQRREVDLGRAFLRKIKLTGERYPVEKCRETPAAKYTEMENGNSPEQDELVKQGDEVVKQGEEVTKQRNEVTNQGDEVTSPAEVTSSSTENSDEITSKPTLQSVTDMWRQFSEERDWTKEHTPRNLTLDLFGEVGEVIEVVLEGRGDELLGEELSDCLASSVRLAEVCGIDLTAAMNHYFSQ